VCGEGGAETLAVPREDLPVVLLQPLHKLCRAIDVGEKQRDGPAGQLGQQATSSPD
jgi:hypothetical protein